MNFARARSRIRRDPYLAIRVIAAIVALAIATVYALFPDEVGGRADRTFLLLLGAAAVIALIPLDKLTGLKAGGVELTLDRAQVSGAVKAIDLRHAEDERLRSSLEAVERDLPGVQGSRVLWIDDQPHTVLAERRLFRALGVEVVTARSTAEAQDTLDRDNDFDLLITDVQRLGECFKEVDLGGNVVDEERHRVRDRSVAVLVKEDGTRVYELHEGVNFILARLRRHANDVIRELPVVFYAAYTSEELRRYTRLVPGATYTNGLDGLVRKVVPLLARSRSDPIPVPPSKKPTAVP